MAGNGSVARRQAGRTLPPHRVTAPHSHCTPHTCPLPLPPAPHHTAPLTPRAPALLRLFALAAPHARAPARASPHQTPAPLALAHHPLPACTAFCLPSFFFRCLPAARGSCIPSPRTLRASPPPSTHRAAPHLPPLCLLLPLRLPAIHTATVLRRNTAGVGCRYHHAVIRHNTRFSQLRRRRTGLHIASHHWRHRAATGKQLNVSLYKQTACATRIKRHSR